MKLSEMRKAVVALIGVVALLVASGTLHGTAQTVAQAVLSIATTLGVYHVPNSKPQNK